MKKLIALLLAAAACLSLVACSSKDTELEGLQKEVYDAAKTIGCKEVASGYEYSFPDFELKDGSKQEVKLLLLVADGTPYIVDREDGKVYAEEDVPQDFEVDSNSMPIFEDKTDIYSMLIFFDQSVSVNNGILWANYETLTPISDADLKAVNDKLKS